MLENSSLLVIRNKSDLKGPLLLVEPPSDRLGAELQNSGFDVDCFTTNAAVAQNWQQQNQKPAFLGRLPVKTYASVVVFHPKSKEQLPVLLAELQSVFGAQTLCFVVGDNKGGIKSLPTLAEKIAVKAYKLDNAKHCLWFELDGLAHMQTPKLGFIQFPLHMNETTLRICSKPGVFNHGKLDLGTKLLLENLSHVSQGQVLDFACGAGIVGAFLKAWHPSIALVASDISTLAVESTQATLHENNLQGQIHCVDGVPTESGLFDHIVSNPPFHTGLKTDLLISENLFKAAKKQLKSTGSLTLVANVHLPYKEQLTNLFTHVKELARRDGFVVYYCQ